MKIRKAYIALGLMIASIFFFEFAAHADESNESTKVTFNAPIQIPGQVLPAGTYTLKQVDPDSDSNLLQIFSADRTVLYATVQAISAERREPTGDTSITLAQQGGSEPDVLVKWFYPGRTIGHEFVYPKQQEQAIAQDTQKTFVGNHVVFGGEAAAGE